MFSLRVALVGALVASQSVSAFFRMPCDNPLIVERADPIISPGAISGHTHTIAGGSNFALNSSAYPGRPRHAAVALTRSYCAAYNDMTASQCTSCRAKQDKSAYWTPLLYIAWKNGTFTSVPQVGGQLVYYLCVPSFTRRTKDQKLTRLPSRSQRYHSSDTTEILAFPPGFKMLAGSPMRRTYNDSNLVDQAIGWNCLGSASPTRNPWLPKVQCPDGLRAEVRFPVSNVLLLEATRMNHG